jgi:hypothetical protein
MAFVSSELEHLLEMNALMAGQLRQAGATTEQDERRWNVAEALHENNRAGFNILRDLYVEGPKDPASIAEKYGVHGSLLAVAKLYRGGAVRLEDGKITLSEEGKTFAWRTEQFIGCPLQLYSVAEQFGTNIRRDLRRSTMVFEEVSSDLYRVVGARYVGLFVDADRSFILDSDRDMGKLTDRVQAEYPTKFANFRFGAVGPVSIFPPEPAKHPLAD